MTPALIPRLPREFSIRVNRDDCMAILSGASREQAIEAMNDRLFGVRYTVDPELPRGVVICECAGEAKTLILEFGTVNGVTQAYLREA